MVDFEYDFPMPDCYIKPLIEVINTFKKEKALVGFFSTAYLFSDVFVEKKKIVFEKAGSETLKRFQSLGILEILETQMGNDFKFMITPKGYKWAKYIQKKRFWRWLYRQPSNIKGCCTRNRILVIIILDCFDNTPGI